MRNSVVFEREKKTPPKILETTREFLVFSLEFSNQSDDNTLCTWENSLCEHLIGTAWHVQDFNLTTKRAIVFSRLNWIFKVKSIQLQKYRKCLRTWQQIVSYALFIWALAYHESCKKKQLLSIIKHSAHIIHGKILQTAAKVLTCVLMHCK